MGKEQRKIDSQNNTQIAINDANIAAQREENQKDRDFQTAQWQREFEAQSEFQRSFWKEQFEAENAYNSPTAQVARLQAAGINPAALVSNISGVASESASPSASAPSPSSPSGGHGLSGSIPTAMPISTDAALFSSLAQLNDSLNNAAKVGLQANEQNVMLDRLAQNMSADTASKQAATRSMNLDASIKAVFGNSKARAEIDRTLAEAKELEAKGDLNGSLQKYYQALEVGTTQENAYKKDAYPVMLEQLKTEIDNIKSEIRKNNAQANEANATAKLRLQEKETEFYNTELRSIEADNSYQSKEQALETMLKKLRADAAEAQDREIVAECNNILDTFIKEEYKNHPDAARLDAAIRKTGVLIKTISPVVPHVR